MKTVKSKMLSIKFLIYLLLAFLLRLFTGVAEDAMEGINGKIAYALPPQFGK